MQLLRRKTESCSITLTEYKQYNHLRLLSLLMVGAISLGIIFGTLFIYNNIYAAIDKTRSSLFANTLISVETLDFARYDDVIKAWEERANVQSTTITRDPFSLPIPAVPIEKDKP